MNYLFPVFLIALLQQAAEPIINSKWQSLSLKGLYIDCLLRLVLMIFLHVFLYSTVIKARHTFTSESLYKETSPCYKWDFKTKRGRLYELPTLIFLYHAHTAGKLIPRLPSPRTSMLMNVFVVAPVLNVTIWRCLSLLIALKAGGILIRIKATDWQRAAEEETVRECNYMGRAKVCVGSKTLSSVPVGIVE